LKGALVVLVLLLLALHAYSFESSLTSRSGVGGEPDTLKAFRFTI
jgi:hypothetical protein